MLHRVIDSLNFFF